MLLVMCHPMKTKTRQTKKTNQKLLLGSGTKQLKEIHLRTKRFLMNWSARKEKEENTGSHKIEKNKERAAAAASAPKSPKPVDKKKASEKPAAPAGVEKPTPAEKTAEKEKPPAGAPSGDKKKVEKKKAAAPAAKKPGEKPSALTSVIHPALGKLTKSTKDEHVVKALEDLKEAFDAAEAVQPGIVHNFIAQVIETLKSAS